MFRRWVWIGALLALVPIGGFAAGVGLLRVVQAMNETPSLRHDDFSAITAEVGSPIVLLSTSTCPWCEKTRMWLDARRVNYRDCIVDQDAFAAELLERIGGDSVPQLINAESAASGYVPDVFADIVRAAPEGAVQATVQRCAAPDRTTDVTIAKPEPSQPQVR